MADRNGYIGRAPGDSSVVIARQSFEPSGIQTNFTFSSGYTVGYIDVYYNGVKLIEATDYNATDGSTVGLSTYSNSGDIIELVAYKAFNVGNVTDATGNFTVGTPDITVNNLTAGFGTITSDLSVTGNVTVGGTLTYENLTNQDVLGLATYRSGLNVGSTEASGAGVAITFATDGNAVFGRTGIITAVGGTYSGTVTANEFEGSGAKLTGLPAGFSELDAALFN